MASKDSARGKQWERDAGSLFGLRRRRNGEGLGFDDCVNLDGTDAAISLECKSYQRPMLLTADVNQARRNAGDRPWVLAQRPKGWRRPIAVVDLKWLAELCELAGLITPPPTTTEETTNAGGITG